MRPEHIGRRRVLPALLAVGLAPVASVGRSQESALPTLPYPASSFGGFHSRALREISKTLGKTPPATKEGLLKLVEYLRGWRLIDDVEAKELKALVEAIFDSQSAEEMLKRAQQIYEQLKKVGKDVSVAIASIAVDSIEYAKQLGVKRVIFLVASDLSGALLGAGALVKFGLALAAVGALAGGVAGSLAAWYQSEPKH